MPTNSKTTKKSPSKSKTVSKKAKLSVKALGGRVYNWMRKRVEDYQARRPHRSFRRTRRRDYSRSLKLPGLIAMTHHVNRTLWSFRKVFIGLALIYGVLTALVIGIGSQETYSSLTEALGETSSQVFGGDLGQVGQASLLFLSIATTSLTSTPTESQQIYAVIMALLAWLTTVWLLRHLVAGHKVKLRDGLYSSGAPLIGTFLVALVLVIQLLPIALAIIGYAAANASGLLAGGVEAMLFWIAAGLLALLSLYLITSTFFALIIVTLPGMYPMKALSAAGDMVIGRRVRILIRILWMFLVMLVFWAVIAIPFILLDTWLKSVWTQIAWLPIIPIVILLLGSITIVWSSSYIYLLYRKVVEDGARPA